MTKPTRIVDAEVYANYFCVQFLDPEKREVTHTFEMHPPVVELDRKALSRALREFRLVTFNGINYDVPILALAERGASTAQLKRASDLIILNNLRPWQLARQMGFEIPEDWDHVDLIEVAPGVAGLKIYGGRMHSERMQDLPIEPDAHIRVADRPLIRAYNRNDLLTTADLLRTLTPQIALRERMSADYGIDLRSKSDAQIAEAVIARQVAQLLGRDVKRPEIPPGTVFRYRPPKFIAFASPALREVLDMIRGLEFAVPDSGKLIMPKVLAEARIAIGGSVYRMGIGGLHSSEQSVAYHADDEHILIDRDVTSYYPAIILGTGLRPKHMGGAFTQVYRSLVERRVAAKHIGDKVTADALKVVVNGSFGKLGSKWSRLYSPDLMIQTTLTGQLSLLMLIEALEAEGIVVVSANTDGVVIRCHISRVAMLHFVVWEWEQRTGFETEETAYRAIYSRDVNNYVAVKRDGGVKLKGAYALAGLQKNPTNEVCVSAVVKHLVDGTPVEQTVRACRDIRRFVTIRQVKGGAVKDGEHLGKAVRWYYARGVEGVIAYRVNGYTVARTEGARPLMELPEAFPDDVDFDWYIREAHSILADIGAPVEAGVADLV